ncbi:DUF1456 family protein [Aliiglaciecola sp. NS0011-25]|uniref:DUF1456 family protein n=1 Tax=Aliiglaciecola sp. NS0011-25 TaxID=3127654 RepID=UPI003106C400
MIHNDILRRLRYALRLDDTATIAIFSLANYEMEKDYLSMLMKKEDEPGFMLCRDKILSLFLDGLIIQRRGKQEGVEPVVLKGSERLSNNDILRKIRIAMSYRDEDMLAILKLANFRLSKGELNAMFRKADHRNYKESGDQVVRNLLKGMVVKYRPDAVKTATTPVVKTHKPQKPNKPRQAISQKDKAKPAPEETNSVWGKVDPK